METETVIPVIPAMAIKRLVSLRRIDHSRNGLNLNIDSLPLLEDSFCHAQELRAHVEPSQRCCFLIDLELHVLAEDDEVDDATLLDKFVGLADSQHACAAQRIDDLRCILALR